jgi:ABC-type spermidine/putrescine transport system permease subunit I
VLFVENIPFGAALAVIALVITILLLYLQARLTRKRYGA